jgi:GNAT superfamily N-acetyltransferase
MHVHPNFRGKGIGKQLLDAAVDAAQREGCYRVQLTSNRQRTDAHRFYERHGLVASHVGFKRQIESL